MKTTARLLIVAITIMFITGCYLFAPLEEQVKSIDIQPKYINMKQGEQTVINIIVDPPEMQSQVDVIFDVEKPDYMELQGGRYNAVLTGYAAGIGTIRAYGPNGTVAEALVNVTRPIEGSTEYYITSRNRVVTSRAGNVTMLSGTLVGGTQLQNEGLVWRVLDERIARIVGGGPAVLLEAKMSGETQIQISHPLSGNTYVADLLVAADSMTLELSDYMLNMQVGTYKEIAAIVRDAVSNFNESQLVWEVLVGENETPIVGIIGSGARVTLNALTPGTQRLIVKADNGSKAYCDIIVSEGVSLDLAYSEERMQPTETAVVDYTYTPATDDVTIKLSNPGAFTVTHDKVAKKITVLAKEEGSGTIEVKTTSGARANFYLSSLWSKELEVESTQVVVLPSTPDAVRVKYRANPPGTTVAGTISNTAIAGFTINQLDSEIIIDGKQEGTATLSLVGSNGISKSIAIKTETTEFDALIRLEVISRGSKYAPLGMGNGVIHIADGAMADVVVTSSITGVIVSTTFTPTVYNNTEWSKGKLTGTEISSGRYRFNYRPDWTMTDGPFQECGVLNILVKHLATGNTKSYAYTIICKWIAW